MKKLFFLLVAIFCGLISAQAALVNAINVVVNESVITVDQVERTILPLLQTAANLYAGQREAFELEAEKIRTNAVEALVEHKLILAEFKTAGYALPESFIDDEVKDQIRKNFSGNRVTLIKTLQENGKTYESFRQEQRERIIVDYLRRQQPFFSQKILISPKQVEAYYREHQDGFKLTEQVKLRVIVIDQPADGAPGAGRKIAEEVLKKLNEGVSFKEMATIYSSGPYRSEGGDRGWVDRSVNLHPELLKTAFALKAGQHSDIIEIGDACYLLFAEDKHAARVKTLEEARLEIEDALKRSEQDRLHKKWIERLRSKSFVRYY